MLGNAAAARGLFEAGCEIVSSYPGTPSTEITEEAAKFKEIYCEWAPNEKVALENIKNTMEYGELSPEAVEEFKAACAGLKDMAYEKVKDPSVVDLLYSEVEKAKAKFPAEG